MPEIINKRQLVIPAKAGIQTGLKETSWIPAFAGMTNQGERLFLVLLMFIANQVFV